LASGVLFQFTSEFYQEKINTGNLQEILHNVIDASSKGEWQIFLIAEGGRRWGLSDTELVFLMREININILARGG